MRLTDYYKLKRLPGSKSKLRFDCIASTGSYEPFEMYANRPRAKAQWLFLYYTGVPDQFSVNAQRKADKSITTPQGKNLSSVYVPDLNNPLLGYGDVVYTNDALLFAFNEDYNEIDIFVARGLKNHVRGLYTLFVDGELNDDIARLREQAQPTGAVYK